MCGDTSIQKKFEFLNSFAFRVNGFFFERIAQKANVTCDANVLVVYIVRIKNTNDAHARRKEEEQRTRGERDDDDGFSFTLFLVVVVVVVVVIIIIVLPPVILTKNKRTVWI